MSLLPHADSLRIAESFEVKNKFPPRLRPLLADVALLAVELGEYDDDFFAALPKLLPYNLFTLKKLVKREIFPRRIELFNEAQEDHLDTIRAGIAETLPGQLAEYEQLKKEWEEDQKGKDQEASEERKRMEVESMKQDQEGDTPERGAGAPMDVDGAASPAPKKGAVAGSPKPGTSPGGGEAKVEEHEGAFFLCGSALTRWELTVGFLRSTGAQVEVPLLGGDEARCLWRLHDRGREVGADRREAVRSSSTCSSAVDNAEAP